MVGFKGLFQNFTRSDRFLGKIIDRDIEPIKKIPQGSVKIVGTEILNYIFHFLSVSSPETR